MNDTARASRGCLTRFPVRAVFDRADASLSAPPAFVTSWSRFGFQRVIAWEVPFMRGRFVPARVPSMPPFPILAGSLVRFRDRG